MKSIGFILDAGQSVGVGHLVRCLALARFCSSRNVQCVFFCPRGSGLVKIGPKHGPQFQWVALPFGLSNLASRDDWEQLHEQFGFDALVVDLWEHQCRPLYSLQGDGSFLKVLLSSFPFAFRPIFYDVHIGAGLFTPGQLRSMEASLTQVATYIGPEYVIVKDEYVSGLKPIEIKEQASRVLVCMGGSDPSNITRRVLEALVSLSDIRLEVVIGPNYEHLATVLPYEERGIRNMHTGVGNLAGLVRSADVAIITGGLLRYELSLAGLPFIAISTFPVQVELSQVFADMGAAMNLGTADTVSDDMILNGVRDLLNDFERRKEMHERLLSIIDGNGPERVWQILDKHCGPTASYGSS